MTNILIRILWISRPRFKGNCLENQQLFFVFLFHFWNLHQILNILNKKMIAIPTLFRKLQNVKNVGRQLSKKHCSRTPFDSQHVTGSQTLVKSAWEHQKKNQKKFLVLRIIAFESGSANSLNLEKDTCHWLSMCYEIAVRFNISPTEIFFK